MELPALDVELLAWDAESPALDVELLAWDAELPASVLEPPATAMEPQLRHDNSTSPVPSTTDAGCDVTTSILESPKQHYSPATPCNMELPALDVELLAWDAESPALNMELSAWDVESPASVAEPPATAMEPQWMTGHGFNSIKSSKRTRGL
ncbi:hypothetical protein ScPMuIL_004906 [Solemya velum]